MGRRLLLAHYSFGADIERTMAVSVKVAWVSSCGSALAINGKVIRYSAVKGPAGEAPQLPREIHSLAASIAQRLGRDVAGDDLFLLALLELPRTFRHAQRSRPRA